MVTAAAIQSNFDSSEKTLSLFSGGLFNLQLLVVENGIEFCAIDLTTLHADKGKCYKSVIVHVNRQPLKA